MEHDRICTVVVARETGPPLAAALFVTAPFLHRLASNPFLLSRFHQERFR
jgi:hypothetical protein